MSDEHHPGDSIAAAKRLASSARLRAALATLWPFVYPVLVFAGGWLVKTFQVESRFATLAGTLANVESSQKTLSERVGVLVIQHEQRIYTIGKQAAYATAAATAGETAKVKAQKVADGQKYAQTFERLVLRERHDTQLAYDWMFKAP